MTKSSPPLVEPTVIQVSSINTSIIYISIILCVIVIGAFFMHKVYKKLQTINQDIININTKGDELDSYNKAKDRHIDILGENVKKYRQDFLDKQNIVPVANNHHELPMNDVVEHIEPLEDITEEPN